MKITVYVPCHNNESTVEAVLKSLRDQSRPADQFLFVDDRCTDKSPEIARQHDFRVLQMPGKKGLAAGRNCALSHAEGDLLLGLDADVVIANNFLEELEKHFTAMPEVAAIGGRMDERFTDTPADLWRAVHMPQHFGPNEQLDTRILFGSSMACRVSVLNQLGGWNERFVSNFEDVDLTGRMKAAGHHLFYTPACQAWHLRRDTPDTVLRTHWNWNYFGFEHLVANLRIWLGQRLGYTWSVYRSSRVADLEHPSLQMLTLASVWAWIVRDLYALRQNAPEVGHVPHVIEIARIVVARYGMKPNAAANLIGWLHNLAASLEDGKSAQIPLNQHIVNMVHAGAMESIPDGNYWQTMPM